MRKTAWYIHQIDIQLIFLTMVIAHFLNHQEALREGRRVVNAESITVTQMARLAVKLSASFFDNPSSALSNDCLPPNFQCAVGRQDCRK